MASFEELKVLEAAEAIADDVWRMVIGWTEFARNTAGTQLVRAADSIGANIAKASGRYHYGEKIQFLYYARGSLFETKYWLNRSLKRALIGAVEASEMGHRLTELARQLNAFIGGLRTVKAGEPNRSRTTQARERAPAYVIGVGTEDNPAGDLFDEDDLVWLADLDGAVEVKGRQSPVTNY